MTAEYGIHSNSYRLKMWQNPTPAVAAIFYPFILQAFNKSLGGGFILPALLLIVAMAIPVYGFYVAWNIGKNPTPNAADIFLKQLAWLVVASPPIFVFLGVVTYMAGSIISDVTIWVIVWLVVSLAGWAVFLRAPSISTTQPHVQVRILSPRLRVGHGLSAVAILLVFLGMHLTNHLAGFLGEVEHRQLMSLFRVIYRARFVEPIILILFLFQVVSGIVLIWRACAKPADFFRSLQLASGAYLIFFILGHMNSVFIYARRFAGIKTDWDFATGAPAGLIHDVWNIRLVPHYYFGVFLVLSHLILAARVVAIGHGVSVRRADKSARIGILLAALFAMLILLGMSGIHPAA